MYHTSNNLKTLTIFTQDERITYIPPSESNPDDVIIGDNNINNNNGKNVDNNSCNNDSDQESSSKETLTVKSNDSNEDSQQNDNNTNNNFNENNDPSKHAMDSNLYESQLNNKNQPQHSSFLYSPQKNIKKFENTPKKSINMKTENEILSLNFLDSECVDKVTSHSHILSFLNSLTMIK